MFFLLGHLFQGLFGLREEVLGGGPAVDGHFRISVNFVLAIAILFAFRHLLHGHTFQFHF